MFNVCPGCGQYTVEKEIDPSGPYAICPRCGHAHRFVRLPLFVVSGASGTGKTTVCLALPALLPECVVLESDILWRPEFNTPEDGYRTYRDLWLRLAKNIHQASRPVVLCGTAVPAQMETCPERRYLAAIHYLALVCDDGILAQRLRARPGWRQSTGDDFITSMTAFNGWLKANASQIVPPMVLLDTSSVTVQAAAEQVAGWVRERLVLA